MVALYNNSAHIIHVPVELTVPPPIPGYTVTYGANGATGGSVSMDSNLYYENDLVTAKGAGDLQKTGYTFAGWKRDACGIGVVYQAGEIFAMPAENVTLYAQ